MSLSGTVAEISRDICGKTQTLTYPTSTWRPNWGDPGWISPSSLSSEN